jgi:hypothetical protein
MAQWKVRLEKVQLGTETITSPGEILIKLSVLI